MILFLFYFIFIHRKLLGHTSIKMILMLATLDKGGIPSSVAYKSKSEPSMLLNARANENGKTFSLIFLLPGKNINFVVT